MLSRQAWRVARPYAARSLATHAPSPNPTPTIAPAPSGSYDPEEDPQLADMAYPKVYAESRQMRNARGWWDRQERINFGEPVPENDDLQSMWAPDVHKVRPSSALGQLLMAFAGVGLFAFGVYSIKPNHPALPRGYTDDGSEPAIGARKLSDNEVEE